MAVTYSFLDTFATISGPGGSINLGAGSAVADEGITVNAREDIDTLTIGCDGQGMHSLHADKSGELTVRLLKTSPVNSLLAQMYAMQTAASKTHGQNTFTLRNPSTGDSLTAAGCAFKKAPDLSYAKDGGLVEWGFNAVSVDRTLGNGSTLGAL